VISWARTVFARNARYLSGVVGVAIIVALAGTALVAWGADTTRAPEDHTPEWIRLHGGEAVADLEGCRDCHDEVSCSMCHLAPWPHPETWQAEHGPESSRTQARGCYLCHSESYCNPCHDGVRMPHPSGFLESHAAAGYKFDSCDVCHVQHECDVCHVEHAAHSAGGARTR